MFTFFEAHKPEFTTAFHRPEFREAVESKSFLFQAAKDSLEELRGLSVGSGVVDGLLKMVKSEGHFDFEATLGVLDKNSDEYKLLRLTGCIMSYFDDRPPMGDVLNERRRLGCEKPHIIAKAMPVCLPKSWVAYLLRFKSGEDVNSFTAPGIRNSILYLLHPESESPTVNEEWRKYILRMVFGDRGGVVIGDLVGGMRHIGIEAANPMNNGWLCDAILRTLPETWEWNKGNKKEQASGD